MLVLPITDMFIDSINSDSVDTIAKKVIASETKETTRSVLNIRKNQRSSTQRQGNMQILQIDTRSRFPEIAD